MLPALNYVQLRRIDRVIRMPGEHFLSGELTDVTHADSAP